MARFLLTGRATRPGGSSIVRASLVEELRDEGHTVYTSVPDGFEQVDYLVTSNSSRNNRTMKYRWAEANNVTIISYAEMWRVLIHAERMRGTRQVRQPDPYRGMPDHERPDDIGAEARMESEGMATREARQIAERVGVERTLADNAMVDLTDADRQAITHAADQITRDRIVEEAKLRGARMPTPRPVKKIAEPATPPRRRVHVRR